jgi:hypothetical protein
MLPHPSIITILPQKQHPFTYRNRHYGNEHYDKTFTFLSNKKLNSP